MATPSEKKKKPAVIVALSMVIAKESPEKNAVLDQGPLSAL
jgi:hypothetical protein